MAKKINSLPVARIKTKLLETFDGLISMDDINKPKDNEDYISHFLSRALVATALMKNNEISKQDSCKWITDGENDGGIDGIYINKEVRTITFIQTKYHDSGKKTISSGELLKFFEGINNLINDNYDSFNDKIKAIKSELKNALLMEDYKIIIELAYTGPMLDERLTKKIDSFIDEINGGQDTAVKEIFSLDEISKYVVADDFCDKIDIKELSIYNLNSISEPQNAVFGLIDAVEIVHLYKEYGNRIFSSNIRYFRGDTNVNEGIKLTVKDVNKKNNFVLYNNGIKAICDSFSRLANHKTSKDLGYYAIKNFSIVNGAQTTGSLSCFSDEELENIKIFITIISMENAEDPVSLSHDITTFSNSQNKINPSDFASLDDFHINLKYQLIADGKDYVYRTGDASSITEQAITLSDLTIASGCYKDLKLAATIKNGYNRVFVNRTSKPYTDFFNSNVTKYFAWNISKIYELISKECKRYAIDKENLDYTIPTHGINYLSFLIFGFIKKNYKIKLNDEYIKQLDVWSNEIARILPLIIDKIKIIINANFSNDIISNVFRTYKKVKKLNDTIPTDDLHFEIKYSEN